MAKKLPYPAYVNIMLAPLTKEHAQELRGKFYSAKGKIARYDAYKEYCQKHGYEYDAAPEGYWASKEEPWHKPAGHAMIAGGYALWFLSKLATTGSRTRHRQ